MPKKKASKKRPVVLKRSKTQINNTKSKRADQKRSALAPGKRRSKKGNIYTEKRSNRSDKSKKKRL